MTSGQPVSQRASIDVINVMIIAINYHTSATSKTERENQRVRRSHKSVENRAPEIGTAPAVDTVATGTAPTTGTMPEIDVYHLMNKLLRRRRHGTIGANGFPRSSRYS